MYAGLAAGDITGRAVVVPSSESRPDDDRWHHGTPAVPELRETHSAGLLSWATGSTSSRSPSTSASSTSRTPEARRRSATGRSSSTAASHPTSTSGSPTSTGPDGAARAPGGHAADAGGPAAVGARHAPAPTCDDDLRRLAHLLAAVHAALDRTRRRSTSRRADATLARRGGQHSRAGPRPSRQPTSTRAVTTAVEELARRYLAGRGPLLRPARRRRDAASTGTATCWPTTCSASTTGPGRWTASSSTTGCATSTGSTTRPSSPWTSSGSAARTSARAFLDGLPRALRRHLPPAPRWHHYVAYRAFVRAKVACVRAGAGRPERADAPGSLTSTLALEHLDAPRPSTWCWSAVLPGTGKSTLAAGLADAARAGPARAPTRSARSWPGSTRRAGGGGVRDGASTPRPRPTRPTTRCCGGPRSLLGLGESVVLDASWLSRRARAEAREVALATCIGPRRAALRGTARRGGAPDRGAPPGGRTSGSDADPGVADGSPGRATAGRRRGASTRRLPLEATVAEAVASGADPCGSWPGRRARRSCWPRTENAKAMTESPAPETTTPDLRRTPVRLVMSSTVVAVLGGSRLSEAVDIFVRTGLRHLVVVDATGRSAGILSQESVTTAWLAPGSRRVSRVHEIGEPPGHLRACGHHGAGGRRVDEGLRPGRRARRRSRRPAHRRRHPDRSGAGARGGPRSAVRPVGTRRGRAAVVRGERRPRRRGGAWRGRQPVDERRGVAPLQLVQIEPRTRDDAPDVTPPSSRAATRQSCCATPDRGRRPRSGLGS